jgi:thioesterase domain-containing protein
VEIVCLQDGESSTAAYCLPSVAGTVEGYLDLAKAIGPGHLVYGIQFADRLDTGKFKEFASLQEMAAAMMNELLAHHHDGPICLIGHSFAAFLAIELAQQLVRHGRSVPLVAMIAWRGPSATLPLPFRARHFMKNVGPWARRVMTRAATDSDYRLIYRDTIVRKLRGSLKLGKNDKSPDHHKFVGTAWYENLPHDHREYVTNNDAILRSYRFAGAYRERILLVRPMPQPNEEAHPLRFDQLEDYGWRRATGASLDVVYTPGDGGSMMRQPHVAYVANALRSAFSECERSYRSA